MRFVAAAVQTLLPLKLICAPAYTPVSLQISAYPKPTLEHTHLRAHSNAHHHGDCNSKRRSHTYAHLLSTFGNARGLYP